MINSVLSFLFQTCMPTAACLSCFKDLTTYFYLSLQTNFSFSMVEIQNAFGRSVPKSEFQSANFKLLKIQPLSHEVFCFASPCNVLHSWRLELQHLLGMAIKLTLMREFHDISTQPKSNVVQFVTKPDARISHVCRITIDGMHI